jgi:hypothetical protein
MEQKPVPVVIGMAGLVGRKQIVRPEPEEEYQEEAAPRSMGRAMPANCLRVLHSLLAPERGGGCSVDCPGLQRDGSCLCDIVRAANEQGVEWKFDLDKDNYWVYAGPGLA